MGFADKVTDYRAQPYTLYGIETTLGTFNLSSAVERKEKKCRRGHLFSCWAILCALSLSCLLEPV